MGGFVFFATCCFPTFFHWFFFSASTMFSPPPPSKKSAKMSSSTTSSSSSSSASSFAPAAVLTSLEVFDVRFPTSLDSSGSDALHVDPDYSACYVRLRCSDVPACSAVGCGLSFTIGRGNELVRQAVDSIRFLVEGKRVREIQGGR